MIEVKGNWTAVFEKLQIPVGELVPPVGFDEILQSQCPIWQDKKIGQTHALIPLPEEMGTLREFARGIEGHNERFPQDCDRIPSYCAGHVDPLDRAITCEPYGKTRWVLFSLEGLPKAKGKPYERLARKVACLGYEVPRIKDVYAMLMLYYAATGKRLYPLEKLYVQETQVKKVVRFCCFSKEVESPMVVGNFGRAGIPIENVLDVPLYASMTTMAVVRTL